MNQSELKANTKCGKTQIGFGLTSIELAEKAAQFLNQSYARK